MSSKVMIVGTGNVGASIGFSFISQRTAISELILTDLNLADAEGEAMDLRDTLAVSPSYLKIRASTYAADAADCDIIIITAGAPQKPGETRLDLLQKNATILKSIVKDIMKTGFHGLFLVVSNPVDLMTFLTWRYSGLPEEQVIGSGTVLDTARLRFRLAERLHTSPKSVHAYQIGEHGDTEFALWSLANLGGQPLTSFLRPRELTQIEETAKNQAYSIINKKGATYYGIGACVTKIVNCILHDEQRVLPISTFDPLNQIYYGFPAILGRHGVLRRLDLDLTEQEGIKLQTSINTLKSALKTINL